nr:T9SS type A sorting domain-containing protein [uncultured Brumimicrobium sp.]
MNKAPILFAILFSLFTIQLHAQIYGCTDSEAENFNESATINDGSCQYIIDTIAPNSSAMLSNTISETSGLIMWNKQLCTHNDSNGDAILYAIDSVNGAITNTLSIPGEINVDWEDLSQDDDYIYIGDFGNNISGNREDLKILKISKSSMLNNSPAVESINFSYSDQIDFTPQETNTTDFDCEAFIVTTDSIFLFTKQWNEQKTSIYALPKSPGTYVAQHKTTIEVEGLITGANFIESKNTLTLCGYSTALHPFIYLIYDFQNFDLPTANKRKIVLSMPFHQVEAITSTNGLKYFITNENFSTFNLKQQLHTIDLTPFLEKHPPYSLGVSNHKTKKEFSVYPVPSYHYINIKAKEDINFNDYLMLNYLGQMVLSGTWDLNQKRIDISELPIGVYQLKIGRFTQKIVKH